MNTNAKSYLVLGEVEDVDKTIEEMNKVTVEDIKKCLQDYFVIKKSSIALVGDIPENEIKALKKEWRTGNE